MFGSGRQLWNGAQIRDVLRGLRKGARTGADAGSGRPSDLLYAQMNVVHTVLNP